MQVSLYDGKEKTLSPDEVGTSLHRYIHWVLIKSF